MQYKFDLTPSYRTPLSLLRRGDGGEVVSVLDSTENRYSLTKRDAKSD